MERQLGTTLEEIRVDHINRYRFAASVIPREAYVLDAACGIGYGAKIISDAGCDVVALDICMEALETANKHYPGPIYVRRDITGELKCLCPFDAVVSFETLEHLPNPVFTLGQFAKNMEPSSLLICSVPNEDRYPFKAEVFANDVYPHLRHYTPAQFDELLDTAGFDVESRHCQKTKYSEVESGTDGVFLVYVCRRR